MFLFEFYQRYNFFLVISQLATPGVVLERQILMFAEPSREIMDAFM